MKKSNGVKSYQTDKYLEAVELLRRNPEYKKEAEAIKNIAKEFSTCIETWDNPTSREKGFSLSEKLRPFLEKWGLSRWIDPDTKKSIADALGNYRPRNPFVFVEGKTSSSYAAFGPCVLNYNEENNSSFREMYHVLIHPHLINSKERFLKYMEKTIFPTLKARKEYETGDKAKMRERGDTLKKDLVIWDAFFTDKQTMKAIAKERNQSPSAVEKSLKRTYIKVMGRPCNAGDLTTTRLSTPGETPCQKCIRLNTAKCKPDSCIELKRSIGAIDAGDKSGKQKKRMRGNPNT